MSKEVTYSEYADKTVEILSKGAFLTTAYAGKVNTMTIGWGTLGIIWGKPVFLALVRHSRFTYELIEKSNEFTVSVPLTDDLKSALTLCGTKSGRDMDKLAAAGLTAAPGSKLATPVIAGCGLHYECKIVYKQAMDPTMLDAMIKEKAYATGDYHTLYFGEILTTYLDD
jgi:flavin reductase (DIM6/NTAB) family NADH-FMN oxidoreductase RutF